MDLGFHDLAGEKFNLLALDLFLTHLEGSALYEMVEEGGCDMRRVVGVFGCINFGEEISFHYSILYRILVEYTETAETN
jgi:hypothetical protein